jgi:hypothetical protein
MTFLGFHDLNQEYENQSRWGGVTLEPCDMTRYMDIVWALDLLARYYPKFHGNEMLLLAEDILKWMNNELPEDSSTLIYLKSYFGTPAEAVRMIWKEIQLLAGPFWHLN